MITYIVKFNFVIIICLLLVSIEFISCCTDKRNDIPNNQCNPSPDEHYFYALGESKEYMYFKEGTWWVYKNTITNELDTIKVYQSLMDTIVVKGSQDYSYQRIYTCETAIVRTQSKKYPYNYYWYSRVDNPDVGGPPPSPLIENAVWVKTRSEGYTSPCFVTPSNLHSRSDIDLISKDTSVLIESILYANVQVFRVKKSNAFFDVLDKEPYNSENYSELYYSKNFGLIKQTKFDSKFSIILVNSNIIQ